MLCSQPHLQALEQEEEEEGEEGGEEEEEDQEQEERAGEGEEEEEDYPVRQRGKCLGVCIPPASEVSSLRVGKL